MPPSSCDFLPSSCDCLPYQVSGSERLRVQLEAKVASEALMRRQLVELSAWLRTLPPRVGSALAKPAADQGGAGAQGGASARRPGTDASTRASIVAAISQQVEAQLATLERQREERDAQAS